MDIKKIGKIIFPVCKGGFLCKMMWRIPKSWSQCSTMLTFWEIGSFLKKMAKWGLWQKTINFFIKLPISQKLSVVVHRDQLFWIPRIILHQKHSFSTGNNFFSIFLIQKWRFYHFCHNDHGWPIYISTLHILSRCYISWVGFFNI